MCSTAMIRCRESSVPVLLHLPPWSIYSDVWTFYCGRGDSTRLGRYASLTQAQLLRHTFAASHWQEAKNIFKRCC